MKRRHGVWASLSGVPFTAHFTLIPFPAHNTRPLWCEIIGHYHRICRPTIAIDRLLLYRIDYEGICNLRGSHQHHTATIARSHQWENTFISFYFILTIFTRVLTYSGMLDIFTKIILHENLIGMQTSLFGFEYEKKFEYRIVR